MWKKIKKIDKYKVLAFICMPIYIFYKTTSIYLLNVPKIYEYLSYLLAFLIVLIVLQYKKVNSFFLNFFDKNSRGSKAFLIMIVVVILHYLFLGIYIQITIERIKKSTLPEKKILCNVTGYSTRGTDRIIYTFMGSNYDYPIKDSDLLNGRKDPSEYKLLIFVKENRQGMFYVEKAILYTTKLE